MAQGGRNWEGFGADPFLSGEGAYETILGMQAGGVQACAKHFINKYVFIPSIFRLSIILRPLVSKSTNGSKHRQTWTTELNTRSTPIRSYAA